MRRRSADSRSVRFGLIVLILVAAAVAARRARTHVATEQKATTNLISTLSPSELAGQRVIYSYHGLTPPANLLAKIRAGQAAGVIFFAANISSKTQLQNAIATLISANARSSVKLPLLLMTDQEGGQVRRLPGAPTLSEKQIGAASNAATLATQAGKGAGTNLHSVGMNVNLAPVLDVYRTPGNFDDQFGRSYSRDPATVAQLGANFITAQQRTGVAATAKHFPGLGAATATQNTDLQPVALHVSLKSLRSIDERPFQSAVAAGVRLVMTSWATYPALDARHPAGLSSAVIQGELRGRLKFTGVTITDALEAGALKALGSTGNRAVLAAAAGMDLILCSSQDPRQGAGAVSALASALHSGRLPRSAFTAAVQRIESLRESS